MTAPCRIGLECPFAHTNDEGEGVCTHPFIKTKRGWFDCRERTMWYPQMPPLFDRISDQMEAQDCPLMEPESKLEDMLMEEKQ